MLTNDYERVERLLDRWARSRRAGRALTVAELCVDAPELQEVLAHRIRTLEWALTQEGTDSLPFSALETALASVEVNYPSQDVLPLSPGDTFDGLRLLRPIGRGGMGEVWEADDPQLTRRVAVKFLRPELAANPTARRRFAREGRACAAVSHENVLTIHYVGEFRDRPFLVMPLLDGESLSARLRQEPSLPFVEVVRIGRAVAAGLDALHARGLTHRDVKPGNIWLGADGSVKLLDLGLAHLVEEASHEEPVSLVGTLIGTPAYMAPEQLEGQVASGRTDLFSLGVVLYQMAAGHNPFAGPTLIAFVSALANHTPAPPSQAVHTVPPAFDELVLGLLDKRPEQRTPDTAAGVVRRLDAIAAGEVAAVCTFNRRKRSCWPLALALSAVLLVACGAVAWIVLRGPTPEQRLQSLAARLSEREIANHREQDKVGGALRNLRHYEFAFKGTTGEAVGSSVRDGTAVVKLPYVGQCDRKSWELFAGKQLPFPPPLTESNPVRGVIELTLVLEGRAVRLVDYKQITSGDVLDLAHDANVSAREAVLELVREVLAEK